MPKRVLDSGYLLDSLCFERIFELIGTNHCIGVANGLDALRILRAYIELGYMVER